MASIEQRGTTFRIVFRYGRRKFNRSLRTKDRKAADACLARLEDTFVALAEQQAEDGSLRIGGPLQQLRSPTNTPGANVLVFVCVHSFEVLTHDEKGERNYSLSQGASPQAQKSQKDRW